MTALLGLLLLAAWPMYQYFPNHNAVLPGAGAVAWQHNFGAKINGGLALSGGVLYVESFDGKLSALDAKSGALRWSAQTGGVVMTTPIVADSTVIAGTGTSHVLTQNAHRVVWGRAQGDAVLALDARTGAVRWRYKTAGEDMPSPVLVRIHGQNAIVFANGDNHLRALRVRDGHLLWQRSVNGIATMSSAAAADGAVFVLVGGAPDSVAGDSLLAVGPKSGRILWSAPYGNSDCSPAVAGHRVFVEGSGSQAGRPPDRNAFNIVYAVDEGTGALRWRWYSDFGTFTGAGSDEEGIAGLAADGVLYQSIPATNRFIAFDARTGAVRWSLKTKAAVKMSAVEKDGRLYFGDTGGMWYVLDARSGRVRSTRNFPKIFTVSSPVISGGTIYVANETVLYALPLGTK